MRHQGKGARGRGAFAHTSPQQLSIRLQRGVVETLGQVGMLSKNQGFVSAGLELSKRTLRPIQLCICLSGVYGIPHGFTSQTELSAKV